MSRITFDELNKRCLAGMTTAERREFDATYAAAKLESSVGEQVRDAREAAGLSQGALASRTGTSQAAIARLEAGGVELTLTALQRVASALELEVSVTFKPAS
jgi:ribosome-binding protein aMBF1 (putative translation factor)